MAKTLFVGDLHGKPDLLPLINRVIKREQIDRMVILGDICDDWTLSNNGMAYWFQSFANWYARREIETIPLLGNHDIPYFLSKGSSALKRIRDIAPGFRPGAHRKVHELMADIPFELAWTDGEVIATHAGLTVGWEKQHDLEDKSIREIVSWMNGLMRRSTQLGDLFMEIGKARGGDSVNPSPLWADLSETGKDGDQHFTQVVGHSPVDTVTRNGNIWYCDTFSTRQDGSSIGDWTLLVKDDKNGLYVTDMLG